MCAARFVGTGCFMHIHAAYNIACILVGWMRRFHALWGCFFSHRYIDFISSSSCYRFLGL